MALPHISQLDPQTQTYMVQAIVRRVILTIAQVITLAFESLKLNFLFYSLLKEAEPLSIDSNRDTDTSTTNKGGIGFSGGGSGSGSGVIGNTFGGHYDPTSLEERQLLGRYGVWLLVGLCTPNEDTPVEILGRLLSMLFHWFHVTAYCFDGIEKRLIHLIFSVGNLTLCIYTLYSSRMQPDVGGSMCRLNMYARYKYVCVCVCVFPPNLTACIIISMYCVCNVCEVSKMLCRL